MLSFDLFYLKKTYMKESETGREFDKQPIDSMLAG